MQVALKCLRLSHSTPQQKSKTFWFLGFTKNKIKTGQETGQSMWHPKQLLHEKVIDALLLGSFTPLQIEFLGWLSYNASALNNSRNPVKAAHTILSKASDPDERMHKMLLTFSNRKMESIQPETVEPHAEADKILDNLAEDIDTALIKAHMRGGKMEDFTKGGVSDGEDSITSDLPGEEKVQ